MMKNNKSRNCLNMLFILLVTAFVTTSCTKEEISKCAPDSFRLNIRALDAQGSEITNKTVKDITLYVFDKNRQFIGVHPDVKIGQSISLNYPNHDILTVVAWGNGMQGHQTMPTLALGDKMETAFVSLIQTKAATATVQSPDDLFHGVVTLTKESLKVENTLQIYRKTAGVAITARHLRQYANAGSDNFTYVLRQTGNKLNFEGDEAGVLSCYKPRASFTENKDEFIAPIFNILTTTSNIEVDILYGEIRVVTILKAPDGKPLRVEAGMVLNILIEFSGDIGDISVNISTTPWGVQQIWKEFN